MEDSGAGRGSVRGLCPRGLRAKAPRGSPPSRHCEQVRGRLYGKGLESKIETHTRIRRENGAGSGSEATGRKDTEYAEWRIPFALLPGF